MQLTALLTLASSFPLNSHNEYAAPLISFSATCDNLPAVRKYNHRLQALHIIHHHQLITTTTMTMTTITAAAAATTIKVKVSDTITAIQTI